METRRFGDELQAFDTQLTTFYDTFQRSKKIILGDSAVLKQNEALKVENESLQRDVKISDDENFFLKRDLEAADAKIAHLERELDDRTALLTKIGAFARSDLPADRKRDLSPLPDLERKRSRRDDPQHGRDYTNGYHPGDRGLYQKVDSGRNTDSLYSRDVFPLAMPGAQMFEELHRANHSPQFTSKVAKFLESQPAPGISIIGAAQAGMFPSPTSSPCGTDTLQIALVHALRRQTTTDHVALSATAAMTSVQSATMASHAATARVMGANVYAHCAQRIDRHVAVTGSREIVLGFMMNKGITRQTMTRSTRRGVLEVQERDAIDAVLRSQA
jgi:hypothetical protein